MALLSVLLAGGPPAEATIKTKPRVVFAKPNLAPLYDQLIDELHRGGAAVYVVPFDTTGVDQTNQPEWWKNCSLSRTISAHGMEHAQAMKRAILQLDLNIQYVESSELCTALSSYTFVLGNNRWLRFFVTPDLNPAEVRRLTGIPDQVIRVQALSHIQTVLEDSVKFLFASPMPLSVAPHPVISELAPGESAIFRNLPNEEVLLLAKLTWRQWQEMSNYYVAKRTASRTSAKN